MERFKTFSERLNWAVKEKGLQQKDLVAGTGISKQVISNYLREMNITPRPENLFAISDYLGVNPRWLATGQGDPWNYDLYELISELDHDDREHILAIIRAISRNQKNPKLREDDPEKERA